MDNETNRTGALVASIGRRHLLKQFAMLGGASLAATAIGPIFPGVAFAQETPKRGGVLAININTEPPNFDPISNTTEWVLNVVGPVHSSLVMFDPVDPDTIVGDLAESWLLADDGKSITFKLKPGVVFHDGIPLTSADVKHTFDTMRNPPEGTASVRKSYFDGVVESIETPDDLTVVFTFAEPQQAMLPLLATGWMLVLPKHVMEAKGSMKDDLIGSGPFKLKEYKRGVSIELVRNEAYHVPDRPYLDGLTFYVTPDPATTYSYFRTGQLKLFTGITGDAARQAQAEVGDQIEVQSMQGLNSDMLSMNARRAPWDDLRVRQAASLAVSRPDAVEVVERGDGVVGGYIASGPFALSAEQLATVPGYGTDIEANRARAKELLTEAGFPEGLDTTILVRKNLRHEARSVFVQDQLSRVGIRAVLNVQETAQWVETFAKREFDLASHGGIDVPVNDPTFAFSFHTTGDANASGLSDPEIDALFAEQRSTTDPVRRKEIVDKLHLAALNASTRIVLYSPLQFVAYHRDMKGVVLHPKKENNVRMRDIWLDA